MMRTMMNVPNLLTKKLLFILILLLGGCCPPIEEFAPTITYTPQEKQIQKLPSAFPQLTKEELCTEWGKELYVGLHFANDLDLYRAITAFKRAKIFLPTSKGKRRNQIDFHLLQCYYLGEKYEEALQVFDTSDLINVDSTFPPSKEMALILYDCYQKTGQEEKGERIYALIEQIAPQDAEKLKLGNAFLAGNLEELICSNSPQVNSFVDDYKREAKSVKKARLYNALLPGAGYAYVGQKQSAITSFCINALFTTAAVFSFRNNNIPLGVILTSLEGGWYFGGIHGAGLAAQKYNEFYYAANGKEVMVCEKLFPILMWETSF